jgi:hypothetical protein
MIFDILKPESILESILLKDPALVEGLMYGKSRPGHPEGKVIFHVREVLDNVDNYSSGSVRRDLRVISFIHDSFKYKVNRSIPRTGDNHHAVIARKFAEKYFDDENEDAIFLVDLGFQFPEADMLGVDYVIPDINYLKDKVDKIKGIVVTHGHLDHIGGIAYLLNKLGNPPIYAGRLTMGLIQKQLEEHGLMQTANLNVVNFVSDQLMFGKMKVSFFRVTHSIPDSCGLFIETPAGSALYIPGETTRA